MDFSLSASHTAYRETVRAFALGTIEPVIAALDAERRFPEEHVTPMAALGLLSIHWPKDTGGAGLDTLAYALALEELARVSPAHAIAVSVHVSLVGVPLLQFGTREQQTTWLPAMARGERLGAFALTETGAGSDAGAVRTSARREGSDYVLNGEKIMVTNGGVAGVLLVVASTDPSKAGKGLSAFLVPGDATGLTRGSRDRLMGLHPADVRTIHFENVRVPEASRVGAEGEGLNVALAGLNVGRIGVAAQATGIAAEVTDRSIEWSRTRQQFGQSLSNFGAIGQMLADMAIDRDVARLLTHEAALARDRGEEFAPLAARAKWTASEAAVANADRAIQVHGGLGYYESQGIERFARDARVTTLYEGTSEMQKLAVARHAVTA
ncbi:MAG: acyl-CoA dehydrogenase family protein [Candidatus Eiseniibacteriota bacterium]